MTSPEKQALVDLLNAHSYKILMAIDNGGRMPNWMQENANNSILRAEREFLAEPEETAT